MKKVIALIGCLLLSLVIVFVLPNFSNKKDDTTFGAHTNEISLIPQEISQDNSTEHTYYKIYNAGELLGVVEDIDSFYSLIDEKSKDYKDDFSSASLSLSSDIYIVDETSTLNFSNINEEIVDYLLDNELLGLKVKMIEITDASGNITSLFVSSSDVFEEAKNKYVSYFVSEDTIVAKANGLKVESPTQEENQVDIDYAIAEKIEISDIIAPPDEVYSTSEEVFNFLCYGKEENKQIYETKQGDTLQFVCQQFDSSSTIIMMLNQDVITSEEQILVPGIELSVKPNWQLTVEVTTQTLSRVVTLPDSPIYVEDETRKRGDITIEIEEEAGEDIVLYEDVYVNGMLQYDDNGAILESTVISRETVKDAIQGKVIVGSMTPVYYGTGNWAWPTSNPMLTCNYTCYANHGGIDIQNRSNFWGEVLASDNGEVIGVGYTDLGGYYVRIDHHNGYTTYYGHMRTYPYVAVGDIVERGDVLGPIGETGNAYGPHIHFAMTYNGTLIDPCTQMACDLIPKG